MSQGYNSLCLPLYLHGRIIPRIVVISCISMCIINHILHFTSSIFVSFHLWGILWKEKKYTVLYTYLHVYLTSSCFPSDRAMFLFSVTILLPEKYPLPFLVVQVFGQPNFSVFIYLKFFFKFYLFSRIFSLYGTVGEGNMVLFSFLSFSLLKYHSIFFRLPLFLRRSK